MYTSTIIQVEDTQLSDGCNMTRFRVAHLWNQLPLLSEKLGIIKGSMPID